MLTCPHCQHDIVMKEVPHEGMFKNYRTCPFCAEKFTPDTDTKYRQAILIVISLFSLVFTILWYRGDSQWIPPALATYVAFAGLLYWGNKKIYLVPYK